MNYHSSFHNSSFSQAELLTRTMYQSHFFNGAVILGNIKWWLIHTMILINATCWGGYSTSTAIIYQQYQHTVFRAIRPVSFCWEQLLLITWIANICCPTAAIMIRGSVIRTSKSQFHYNLTVASMEVLPGLWLVGQKCNPHCTSLTRCYHSEFFFLGIIHCFPGKFFCKHFSL